MTYWILFIIGGGIYVALEFFWRGFSHVSMFLAGGLSLLLFGGVCLRFPGLPMLTFCAIGALIITAVEFITGAIVNVRLGLQVWDYSRMPLNLYGQVCARYSLLWFALSAPAVLLIQLVNAI
ncbi:MAG: hypothetical protein RRZ24_08625 [Clostridia bacterium]